jgi:hypothetical protein
MKLLNTSQGAVMGERFDRLIRYGCTEAQATSLAPYVSITKSSTDEVVEGEVCMALVNAKQAVDGVTPKVHYLSGARRDNVRDTFQLRGIR